MPNPPRKYKQLLAVMESAIIVAIQRNVTCAITLSRLYLTTILFVSSNRQRYYNGNTKKCHLCNHFVAAIFDDCLLAVMEVAYSVNIKGRMSRARDKHGFVRCMQHHATGAPD